MSSCLLLLYRGLTVYVKFKTRTVIIYVKLYQECWQGNANTANINNILTFKKRVKGVKIYLLVYKEFKDKKLCA